MKKFFIWMIKLYQRIPGNWHYMCRFEPTCSNYAIEAIEKYGTIKGLKLAFKRLSKCRPGGGSGYDPVP